MARASVLYQVKFAALRLNLACSNLTSKFTKSFPPQKPQICENLL
ncbi:hypothetical protein CSUNSWCD_945 [Campylobacter showae CSUNSWCD]|uniref:Uncharacterized protein n=1 Tax=Campylobacter showae CSUNSWCD TaxID=1244083 RepID=M5IDK8_9BACT|nr:hypothetical protein CSUNSWCD_945 [Campylobacter showae CSUNSWCD]